MTLGELIECLKTPDCHEYESVINDEVVFDTADRSDLLLLSVYYSNTDGKIHIDIGSEDE